MIGRNPLAHPIAYFLLRKVNDLMRPRIKLARAATSQGLDLSIAAKIRILCVLLPLVPVRAYLGFVCFGPDSSRRAAARKRNVGKGTQALTALASGLAGHRHAHLREAWAADLHGDPDSGKAPAGSQQLKMAAGFIGAALRCRLDDAATLVWCPIDALVSSWHGSNLAVLLPVTIAVGLILSREGFYGLIVNADNLGVIAAAPYAAIKGLRKYRQIDTPKRPEKDEEKQAASAGDPDR
jgi:hypothetical protein